MRPTTVTFALLASIGLGVFFWQRQIQARLRDELNALHPSRSTVTQLQPAQAGNQPPADELAPLRRDLRELAELRRELADLKHPRSAANASTSGRKPLPPGMTPVENLAYVGSATPAAASQTCFWLVAQADVNALAKMLTIRNPAARAKADALMAAIDEKGREELGSSEALIALYLIAMNSRLSGVQMVEQSTGNPDVTICNAMVQTQRGQLSKQGFTAIRTDAGWRMMVHEGLVDFVANELRPQPALK